MDKSTENILNLIKVHGLSNLKVEKACGLSNGTISKWKKGAYKPSVSAIIKLAEYFGVSIESIMGNDKAALNGQPMDSKEKKIKEIMTRAEKLPPEAQEKLNDFIELLESKYK